MQTNPKLFSISCILKKVTNCTKCLDENKFRTQYLNFHGGGKFKHITKTKGAVEIPNVSLNFIGCIHPESVIRFLNREDQNHDGLLER